MVSEQELKRVEDHWQNDVPSMVMQCFGTLSPRQWNVNQVAQHLCLSPRTLRRKLQDNHTCFRSLKHQYAMNLAIQKLGHIDHSVEHVAMSCGYQDVNSFREAFKQFTGQLPSRFK